MPNDLRTFVGSTLTIVPLGLSGTGLAAVTGDVGEVVRVSEGGRSATAEAALEIVDQRRPCEPGAEGASACEAGRPR